MTGAGDGDVEAALKDLDRLVQRLRRFTPRAWLTGDREGRIRALAVALAAIGDETHQLPELPRHGLPDVIAVLGYDALQTQGAAPAVRALLLDALEATR